MQQSNLSKTGLVVIVIVAAFLVSWEGFWRVKGFSPTYNDDKALWAHKRSRAYTDPHEATIFVGSSRIKFDLDIPTWQSITGEEAVQLSLVGTSPILLIEDLANDELFRGKIVIDVTEPLFFSQNPGFHKSAIEATGYYKSQTMSEQLSSLLNLGLESQLTFLEERRFSLNTLLNDLELPNRPGVFSFPSFPKGFEWTTEDRQTYMSDLFLNDSNAIKRQTNIWLSLIMGDKTPPLAGEGLQAVFARVKTAVDKIRERGGKVIFVRTPSSGVMGDGEQKFFPREQYWDAMLNYVRADGIHFLDYEETRSLICPEWSHLSRKQAEGYTKHLAKVLNNQGWFSRQLTIL